MKHIILILLLLVPRFLPGDAARIILDTDMAGDCDDAGALAVLHALADMGEAEILAVVTNRRDLSNASAAAVSAINHYYGRPQIPIGTDKDGAKVGQGRPSPYTSALRDSFPHSARPDDQMPDALQVYRKSLAGAPDNSITICSVGALSNLEDLLRSPADEFSDMDGKELISKKVRLLVVMGGAFPKSEKPETNLRLDPPASTAVVNEWPTPQLWTGFEVGYVLHCGNELIETPADNPVRRSYELRPYGGGFSIDKGKPSYDQTAVLLSVRGPDPEYWNVVKNGRIVTDSDGNSEWKTDFKRPHSYVEIKGSPSRLHRLIEDLMKQAPLVKSN